MDGWFNIALTDQPLSKGYRMPNKPEHPLSKSTVWSVIGGAAFMAVIVIGSYAFNFHDHVVSDTPADWSSFSSYISGMLSPVLSFLSLIFVATTILRDNNWKDVEFDRERIKHDDEKALLRIEHIEKVQKFWLEQYQDFLVENLNDYYPEGHDKTSDYYLSVMTSMRSFSLYWKTISSSTRPKLPMKVHESMTYALRAHSETLMMLLEFHSELSEAYKKLNLPHYRDLALGVTDLFDVLLNCDIETWCNIEGGKAECCYTPFKDKLLKDSLLTHVMNRIPETLRLKYELPMVDSSRTES